MTIINWTKILATLSSTPMNVTKISMTPISNNNVATREEKKEIISFAKLPCLCSQFVIGHHYWG